MEVPAGVLAGETLGETISCDGWCAQPLSVLFCCRNLLSVAQRFGVNLVALHWCAQRVYDLARKGWGRWTLYLFQRKHMFSLSDQPWFSIHIQLLRTIDQRMERKRKNYDCCSSLLCKRERGRGRGRVRGPFEAGTATLAATQTRDMLVNASWISAVRFIVDSIRFNLINWFYEIWVLFPKWLLCMRCLDVEY